jgi:hypothetical protein
MIPALSMGLRNRHGVISARELKAFRETAKENFALTDEQLKIRIEAGHWKELD